MAVPQKRTASIKRKTNETDVSLKLNLDGQGKGSLKTGVAFFDHMLDLFRHHGLFDLDLQVKGDLEVDFHHTVEDVGICLGQAVREALGDAKGISRYSSGLIPMDETLCQMALDISNRPHLTFDCAFPKTKVGQFDVELTEEFFRAFVSHARVTLHIKLLAGSNLHHMIEGCFKAFGVMLDKATRLDPRKASVPSTKGTL